MIELLQLALHQQTNSNINLIVEKEEAPTEEVNKEPEIVKHKVQDNETLTKIAKEYNTTWLRLFNKNLHIEHPDYLNVGDNIVIPTADEVLEQRDYIVTPKVQTAHTSGVNAPHRVNRGNPPAGWFVYRNCTWYIWTKRSVGHWNNASSWYWQAQRDGWATGSKPKVGAIAWEPNHVSYVEEVYNDGTIRVSEYNYSTPLAYGTRVAKASQFRYIY